MHVKRFQKINGRISAGVLFKVSAFKLISASHISNKETSFSYIYSGKMHWNMIVSYEVHSTCATNKNYK